MKNPKVKFILLPLVILVWGVISLQIYFIFSKDNKIQYNKSVIVKSQCPVVKDSIILRLNYPDPFFNEDNEVVKFKSIVPTVNLSERINRTKQKVAWPNVKYCGCIRNHNNPIWIAQIIINNQNIALRQGDNYENITLLSVSKDSIVMRYGKELRTFKFDK